MAHRFCPLPGQGLAGALTLTVGLTLGLTLALSAGLPAVSGSEKLTPNGHRHTKNSAVLHLVRRRFKIDIEYPRLVKGGSTAAIRAANKAILAAVIESIEDEPLPPDSGETKEIVGGTLTGHASLGFVTDSFISLQVDLDRQYTGAAHNIEYTRTLNYDRRFGRDLKLTDIFRCDVNYSQVLSVLSLKRLGEEQAIQNFDTLDLTAHSKDCAWKNFLLTGSGIKLFFDQGDNAAMAEGEKEVFIPYCTLRNLLAQNFALKQQVEQSSASSFGSGEGAPPILRASNLKRQLTALEIGYLAKIVDQDPDNEKAVDKLMQFYHQLRTVATD